MVMPSASLRSIVAALVTSAVCTSASLAARVEGAKLTLAENKVSVASQPKGVGSTVAPGETIVTGARSRAELTLPDGTVVRIGQGSSFSFDGSKLTLNQGSALLYITGKNSKIVTPALTRTGSAGVVSVHASHDYNALFDLKGSDTVNGTKLIAGQAWVSERGATKTFTFDMQKMVGTSTLVTKFPQTPWVAQTTALASVQHQLIAAIKAQPASAALRPVITAAANGSTVVTVGRSSGTPGFLGRLASAFSGKPAAGAGTQGGTLTLSGTNTAGGGVTISGGLTKTGAATLVLNGASTTAGAVTFSSALNAGTLSIGNGTSATISGAGLNTLASGGTLVLNANTGVLGVNSGVATISNSVVGQGALTFGNTVTNVSGAAFNLATLNNAGTINLTNGGTLAGGALTVASGNLVLSNGSIPQIIALPTGSSTTVTINGVTPSSLVRGETVTNNGANSTVGTSAGNTRTKVLTPIH